MLVLIADGDEDMEPEGAIIEGKNIPGVTVGRYDGSHFEPHNAFKYGDKTGYSKSEDFRTHKIRYTAFTPANRPPPGSMVVKDRSLPIGIFNEKVSTGRGCLRVIEGWIGAL